MILAEVQLWGRTIGAVSLQDGATTAAFEYVPVFVGSGIELSPLRMPLRPPLAARANLRVLEEVVAARWRSSASSRTATRRANGAVDPFARLLH